MDNKLFIPAIKSILVHLFRAEIKIKVADLKFLITKVLLDELPKIPLPKGVLTRFKKINSFVFNDNHLTIQFEVDILSSKLLMPKQSTMMIDFEIDLLVNNGYLQCGTPVLSAVLVNGGWKDKVMNPIVLQILKRNKGKIDELINAKINPLLREPFGVIGDTDKLKDFSHLMKNADYNIVDLKSSTQNDTINLYSKLCVSTKSKIERNMKIDDSLSSLIVDIDPLILFPLLLKQLNADIKTKLDQEVHLESMQVIAKNTLSVNGRAVVMNIEKSFILLCEILFDTATQKINLKVLDIEVHGGFLVKSAFSLIEPKVRKSIEQAVDVPLKNLIENVDIPMQIPETEIIYKARFEDVDVRQISIEQRDDLVEIKMDISEWLMKV